jgi:UDP-glucose 4-epimerase
MKVCVTGGAGFIGGHLIESLLGDGHDVVCLDDFSSGKRENAAILSRHERFTLIEGSIANPADVKRALRDVRRVFHLAAIPSVPVSMNEPARTTAVNVGGTVNVLEGAKAAGAERVVLACSCAAYGDGPEQPKHELLQPRPLSPYAAQKIACELLAQTWTRAYGLPCVALRFFNVYGPRQDPKSEYAAAIPRFTTRLLAGQPPIVFGDGQQTRDFVHVSDVVRAVKLAAESEKAAGEVINIASGRSSTLLEIIGAIKQIIGSDALIEHQAPRAGDLRESSANIDKARALLGFEPAVSLEQGLAGVVEFFRNVHGQAA